MVQRTQFLNHSPKMVYCAEFSEAARCLTINQSKIFGTCSKKKLQRLPKFTVFDLRSESPEKHVAFEPFMDCWIMPRFCHTDFFLKNCQTSHPWFKYLSKRWLARPSRWKSSCRTPSAFWKRGSKRRGVWWMPSQHLSKSLHEVTNEKVSPQGLLKQKTSLFFEPNDWYCRSDRKPNAFFDTHSWSILWKNIGMHLNKSLRFFSNAIIGTLHFPYSFFSKIPNLVVYFPSGKVRKHLCANRERPTKKQSNLSHQRDEYHTGLSAVRNEISFQILES